LPTEAQHMQQVFSSANDPVDQPIVEDTKPNVPAATSAGRKRRKQDGGGADSAPHTPAEPRRLRRSHEVREFLLRPATADLYPSLSARSLTFSSFHYRHVLAAGEK
jgi:hypothetical protein